MRLSPPDAVFTPQRAAALADLHTRNFMSGAGAAPTWKGSSGSAAFGPRVTRSFLKKSAVA
jgi:hypothetical protein